MSACFFHVIWVVVSNMFYVHPYLGKSPILTSICFKWVVKPPPSDLCWACWFFRIGTNYSWNQDLSWATKWCISWTAHGSYRIVACTLDIIFIKTFGTDAWWRDHTCLTKSYWVSTKCAFGKQRFELRNLSSTRKVSDRSLGKIESWSCW